MSLPIRTLAAADAEVMARTVEPRTSVGGRVECHGLIWKSDALLNWEHRQRERGRDPKVDVRIDELDLHIVYVSPADGSDGPFRAISTQPEFTKGLSLFELRRFKKAIKDKALKERIHRLSDQEATKMRLEFYALLGHGKDPAAQKRLSELQDALAKKRLEAAGDTASDKPDDSASEKAAEKEKKLSKPRKPASRSGNEGTPPPATPKPTTSGEAPLGASPTTPPVPSTPMRKPGELPQRKFTHFNLDRRDQ